MSNTIIIALLIVYLLLIIFNFYEDNKSDKLLSYIRENPGEYQYETTDDIIGFYKIQKGLKKSKVKSMVRNTRNSAISGGIFGLASKGTMGGTLKSALMWACIGGIRDSVIKLID